VDFKPKTINTPIPIPINEFEINKPIQNRFQNYRFMGIILINTFLWALINGKKDKNNGIAIVFGLKIRQISIQVGKGLENKLKDDEAKNIIDNVIIPEFKKGDSFAGIKKGLIAIINKIK
jgi:hypothetical protein